MKQSKKADWPRGQWGTNDCWIFQAYHGSRYSVACTGAAIVDLEKETRRWDVSASWWLCNSYNNVSSRWMLLCLAEMEMKWMPIVYITGKTPRMSHKDQAKSSDLLSSEIIPNLQKIPFGLQKNALSSCQIIVTMLILLPRCIKQFKDFKSTKEEMFGNEQHRKTKFIRMIRII